MTSPASHRFAALGLWSRWLVPVAMALTLGVAFVQLPGPLTRGLDPSWNLVLTSAHRQQLQFGPEIAFTYGPFGFLNVLFTSGEPPALKMLWETVGKFALAATFVALSAGLSWWRRIAVWLFLLASASVLLGESAMLWGIALIVIRWLLPREARPWQCALGLGWLACFAAMKFTLLLAAVAGVLTTVAALVARSQWRRALVVAGGFAAGYLALWLAAGQAWRSLLLYFKYGWESSNGYSWAMNLNSAPPVVWWLGGAMWLAAALFVVRALRRAQDRTFAWPAVAMLALVWYLAWKHGFTRADGHVIGFFICASLLALAAPRHLLPHDRMTWLDPCPILGLLGFGLFDATLLGRVGPMLAARFHDTSYHLVHRAEWRAGYDAGERAAKAARAHPDLQAAIGRATVDILSVDQAFIFANDLNYRPRPVFQGYAAYTPLLLRHNLRFFQSPRAPEFLIARLETIDNRYPAQEDSLVLAELRRRYELVGTPREFALLRRKSAPPARIDQPQQTLLSRSLRFGEELPLPPDGDFALWLKADMSPSLWGTMLALLAQPPLIEIVLTDDTGKVHRHRIVPAIAAEGFIVQPLLQSQADLNAFLGGHSLRRARSLHFETRPGMESCWKEIRVQVSRLMDNAIESYNPMRRYVDGGYFNLVPESVTSEVGVEEVTEAGRPALQIHAPGEIAFRRLAAGQLTGTFGLRTGSYGPVGASDGVEFSVELRRDNGSVEVLWRRHLDPRQNAADRGPQTFTLPFPPGDHQLVLRTLVGPNADGQWDWSYWADIRFTP